MQFFARILFYWNSHSFFYFLCNKWIWKIINPDSDVINNRMLSLFNCVLILFEEQKITCIYFCQSSPLMKTLCIAILKHLCRTPPLNFLDPPPIIFLTLKSIKLLFNLDHLKIKKLNLGKYTKCSYIHFKAYFKNLAYV